MAGKPCSGVRPVPSLGATEVMGDTDITSYPPLNLHLGGLLHGNLTSGMNKTQECYPLYLWQWKVSRVHPEGIGLVSLGGGGQKRQ